MLFMVSMVSVFLLSFPSLCSSFLVGFRLHTQEKKYVFFLLVFLVCFCLSRREFCVSQNVYLEIMKAVYGFYGFCVSFVFLLLFLVVCRGFSFTHTREKIRVFFSCLFLSLKKGILCFSKCIPGNNECCLWFLWFLCFFCLSLPYVLPFSWVFVYTHKRKNTCFFFLFFLFVFVSQEGNFVFLKM